MTDNRPAVLGDLEPRPDIEKKIRELYDNPPFAFVGEEDRQLAIGIEPNRFVVHIGIADKLVPLERLKQHPRNYRNGDIERIGESLHYNGQFRGIVVNVGTFSKKYEPFTILAGNHTYQSALSLEWTHIAVDFVDVDDERADDILLADNATSDAAWNDQASLAQMLSEKKKRGKGLVGTGHTEEEAERMIGRVPGVDDDDEEGSGGGFKDVTDVQTEHKCPSCGYEW